MCAADVTGMTSLLLCVGAIRLDAGLHRAAILAERLHDGNAGRLGQQVHLALAAGVQGKLRKMLQRRHRARTANESPSEGRAATNTEASSGKIITRGKDACLLRRRPRLLLDIRLAGIEATDDAARVKAGNQTWAAIVQHFKRNCVDM